MVSSEGTRTACGAPPSQSASSWPLCQASAVVAARVARARTTQTRRYRELGLDGVRTNADCPVGALDVVAAAEPSGVRLLRDAADQLRMTARGYHRVLKVARTLADLDGDAKVGRTHLAEALAYRGAMDMSGE